MDEKTNEKKADEKTAEKAEVVELNPAKAPEADNNILKLSRTYRFEDQDISELDLSGLEDLTVDDMIRANKALSSSGTFSVLPETDLQYTITLAVKVTGLPVEFFKQLKPRDGIKVKNRVTSFLFGGD